jgi:hypothetical protein
VIDIIAVVVTDDSNNGGSSVFYAGKYVPAGKIINDPGKNKERKFAPQ